MPILLYPTRRDLATDVVKGPVVIIERFMDSTQASKFFTSIFANGRAIDRREHPTLGEAIDNAVTRDRDGVRINKPASFNPPDASREALDMGVAGVATEPPPEGDTER